jgi:hypothetical protein
MYLLLLSLHSFCRWLVLAGLVYTLFRAYRGWLQQRAFLPADNRLRHITATLAHIQLLLGLGLYFTSPVTGYFLHHYKQAVHERAVRFFGMEHSIMMFVAVLLITIGSVKAKRQRDAVRAFRTIAVWYSIALLVIVLSVPWPFSPMAGRPYLRLP